jgi:hypothetical protein
MLRTVCTYPPDRGFHDYEVREEGCCLRLCVVPNVLLEGADESAGKSANGVNGTNGINGVNGTNGMKVHAESEHINGSGSLAAQGGDRDLNERQ